jgi:hypothetical protein
LTSETQETIHARVVFRKQLSDGNYGSEVAEVMLDVPLGEVYDLSEEAVAATLQTARRLVHEELGRSPSGNVRHALEPPKPPRLKDYATAPDEELEDLPL